MTVDNHRKFSLDHLSMQMIILHSSGATHSFTKLVTQCLTPPIHNLSSKEDWGWPSNLANFSTFGKSENSAWFQAIEAQSTTLASHLTIINAQLRWSAAMLWPFVTWTREKLKVNMRNSMIRILHWKSSGSRITMGRIQCSGTIVRKIGTMQSAALYFQLRMTKCWRNGSH